MKKLLSFFFLSMLIFSCQKESNLNLAPEITPPPPDRITICHATNSESNPWVTLEINENAWPGHEAHGDINPDSDGDGFTAINPCGIGDETDCDDGDASINPDADEACDDGVDNNCDGLVDCNDPDCEESDLCVSCCFDDVLHEFVGDFEFINFQDLGFVTFLQSANPNFGIAVLNSNEINPDYGCNYNAPQSEFGFFIATEEEYTACRQAILDLAEELGLNNAGEESITPTITLKSGPFFSVN